MADFFEQLGKKISDVAEDLECISLCEPIEKREEEAAQCQEEIHKIQEVVNS